MTEQVAPEATPIDAPTADQPQEAPKMPSDAEIRQLLINTFVNKYREFANILHQIPNLNEKLINYAFMNLDQGFRWALEALHLMPIAPPTPVSGDAPDAESIAPANDPEVPSPAA